MINKNMAAILGMDIPEEIMHREIIEIPPHEIVSVDNPNLPAMHDINRKQLQGEHELQQVIDFTLGYQKTLFDDVGSIEPKYRSRSIEVANATMGIALDAIKVKLKTQEEKKKIRLKEAEFVPPSQKASGDTTNNWFVGSREELIAAVTVDVDDDDE
jgi:hypothetical protein